MENAVTTVHKCYDAIVAYLQSNEAENTVGDVIPDSLLKEVLQYKLPAFTAVLSDVLSVVGRFSKKLQSETLDLRELMPLKESALGRLNGLKESKGLCETEFHSQVTTSGNKMYYKGIPLTHANEKSQIEKLKVSDIDSVWERIESRIATDEVLEAFSVIEPQSYDSLTDEERTNHLKSLVEKYHSDFDTLKREYPGMKYLMRGSYKNMKFGKFCIKVMNTYT